MSCSTVAGVPHMGCCGGEPPSELPPGKWRGVIVNYEPCWVHVLAEQVDLSVDDYASITNYLNLMLDGYAYPAWPTTPLSAQGYTATYHAQNLTPGVVLWPNLSGPTFSGQTTGPRAISYSGWDFLDVEIVGGGSYSGWYRWFSCMKVQYRHTEVDSGKRWCLSECTSFGAYNIENGICNTLECTGAQGEYVEIVNHCLTTAPPLVNNLPSVSWLDFRIYGLPENAAVGCCGTV